MAAAQLSLAEWAEMAVMWGKQGPVKVAVGLQIPRAWVALIWMQLL